MDAAAELGRNPVSKHQIQPEYGDEQADAGRDGWTHLARPNSQARTGTGEYLFSLFNWPRAGLATLPGWPILCCLKKNIICDHTYIDYIHTVCVAIPFILEIRLVDVSAGVTQEVGRTGFLHLSSVILSGGYAPDSAKAEGSSIVDEPGEGWTPVRENHRLEPGGFWGKSWSLTTVIFLPTRTTRSGERARFVGVFSRMHRALDGWRLARAPASPVQGLHHHGPRYFNFPYFCTKCVALRNLDLLIKTGWSVIFPVFCWERWSWVGDNIPSRSRLLSIWSKEVWWTVLILVGAIACRAA